MVKQKKQLREALGCEKTTQAPVWLDEEDEFFNCPRQFISKGVYDFIGEYDAYKNGWAMPLFYGGYSNLFIEAVAVYERYFSQYIDELKKRPPPGEMTNNFNSFQRE